MISKQDNIIDIFTTTQPGSNSFNYNRGKDIVDTKIFYKDCNETEGIIKDRYRNKEIGRIISRHTYKVKQKT